MKKKTYIIKYLTKNTTTDEKTIRKDLRDFWKRYPQHGVDGIYGYILNGRWEYRNRTDIAREVLQDVQNAEKQASHLVQRNIGLFCHNYKVG